MTDSADKPRLNPFVRDGVFTEPSQIFTFRPKSVTEIKDTALVVLDTNALLVPYGAGQESLAQIKKTHEVLTTSKRLVIPAQVAREFAEHRPEKLKTLYQQLSR